MTFFILAVVFIIALLFVLGLHTFDKVDTETEIDGTTDEVWKVISNFQGYTDWNPTITNASGEMKEGSTVGVTFSLPFSKSMDLNLLVQDIDKGRAFSLISTLLEPKILDSVHYLSIEKAENGNVKFCQGEKFSGLLLYLVFPFIKSTLEKSFEEMNKALKNRVEGVVEFETSSSVSPSGV